VGSSGTSSPRRFCRLYRVIKSGLEGIAAAEDDDATGGGGNSRWYGESGGAFDQLQYSERDLTGGREFRAKMLFVVSSTEPVRERSYAIELAGRCGNIV